MSCQRLFLSHHVKKLWTISCEKQTISCPMQPMSFVKTAHHGNPEKTLITTFQKQHMDHVMPKTAYVPCHSKTACEQRYTINNIWAMRCQKQLLGHVMSKTSLIHFMLIIVYQPCHTKTVYDIYKMLCCVHPKSYKQPVFHATPKTLYGPFHAKNNIWTISCQNNIWFISCQKQPVNYVI